VWPIGEWGAVAAELLDHVIAANERDVRRLLAEYIDRFRAELLVP
jgi:hypothetical protein